ncbi:MAG: YggS family pyridoxal phosphate-dependent enzyme [Calditerrivibrio sp.]|nr:YggS family pyridoxal phosphate-dependent enzyme [Calditerrivibrio sp.]
MIENIMTIIKKIDKAALRSGRNPQDIVLVAVSKTFPVEKILDAYRCGLRVFGESRIQEALDKIAKLSDHKDIKFHLIGHIQTNKIKLIKDNFALLHSVDSAHLALKLNNYFNTLGIIQDVLVQVNLVNEPQKYGVKMENYYELLNTIKFCVSLNLRGLMFIPPYRENPEENRLHFRNMKKLFDETKVKYDCFRDFNILSMGMSDDFEIAIEEGSNMVRIGTAIFGER